MSIKQRFWMKIRDIAEKVWHYAWRKAEESNNVQFTKGTVQRREGYQFAYVFRNEKGEILNSALEPQAIAPPAPMKITNLSTPEDVG